MVRVPEFPTSMSYYAEQLAQFLSRVIPDPSLRYDAVTLAERRLKELRLETA